MNEQQWHESEQMFFHNRIMNAALFYKYSKDFSNGDYSRITSVCGSLERMSENCKSIIRYILNEGTADSAEENAYVVDGLQMYHSIYLHLDNRGEFLLTLAFLTSVPLNFKIDAHTSRTISYFTDFSFSNTEDTKFRVVFNNFLIGNLMEEEEKEKNKYEKLLKASHFIKNGNMWELSLTNKQSDRLFAAYQALKAFSFINDEEIDEYEDLDVDIETLDDIKLLCRTDFVSCQVYCDEFPSLIDGGDPRITITEFMDYVKAYQEKIGDK